MTIRDSSIVRSFKISKYEIKYDFASLRNFLYRIMDLTVSIGIVSLIMDMTRGIGESAKSQWATIMIVWVILKFYYCYVSFDSLFKVTVDNGGKR